MEPVADHTRSAVWNTLCDLEYNWRYYDAMADKYRRRYRALRFTILAGVLVELVVIYFAMAAPWVFFVGVALGALLAALTIWDAFSDHAQDAATLRVTAHLCDDLKLETEALWRSIEAYRIGPQDAEARLHSILERWGNATQRVQLGTDSRLNRQASAAAKSDIAHRYAVLLPDNAVGRQPPAPRNPGPPRPTENPRPQPPPRPPAVPQPTPRQGQAPAGV